MFSNRILKLECGARRHVDACLYGQTKEVRRGLERGMNVTDIHSSVTEGGVTDISRVQSRTKGMFPSHSLTYIIVAATPPFLLFAGRKKKQAFPRVFLPEPTNQPTNLQYLPPTT